MNRWFRLYADAMRNPKVARLSDKDFRLWVRLLAVASENEGALPCLGDLKHLLMMRLDHLSTGLDRLISGGLIDVLADGYEPHHWSKFQYKSDTSTDRVHKHRAKRNVSVTPPDSEADTDTEVTVAKATLARVVFPRPDWCPVDLWDDWLAVRKTKKGRNTATAYQGFLDDIARYADAEWTPEKILRHAVKKSWAGIYDPKEERNGQRITNGRTHRRADDIDEAAARLGFT